MNVREFITVLNRSFPEYIQESYDNTGAQIVFLDNIIKKIYICLDADSETIADAVSKGCNVIVCHHPLIFRPLKKVSTDESRSRMLIEIVNSETSLYAMHTNFDKIMFKYLSDFLGFPEGVPLIKSDDIGDRETGYGSFVTLERGVKFCDILERVKSRLGLDFVIFSGDKNRNVTTMAFINGSGGGSIEKIIGIYKPDCIITGDVTYHHAKYAIDNSTAVIDAGHYGTEIIFKKLIAESVADVITGENIEIIVSEIEKNPFKVY